MQKKTLLAALAVVALVGCAPIEYGCDNLPRPRTWPLQQPTPLGVKETRPTVLVIPELGGASESFWHEGFEPFRKVETSGLFSRVYTIDEKLARDKDPDLSLIFSASHDRHDNLFSIVGILTLGAIPFWRTTELSVDAVLYDWKTRAKLGEWKKSEATREIFWMPFLVPYLVSSVGDLGGPFDSRRQIVTERAGIENAVANVLVEIQASGVLERLPSSERPVK